MVPPTTNRVRGKTKEKRKREKRKMDKANALHAGKLRAPSVKDRGKGVIGIGKKKQKKKEQRARLLLPKGISTKMEE